MQETPRGGGLKGLLGHRGFRALLIGQGVSALGDWMVTVALMALVLDISGSSVAVGVVLVLRLAPAALAGPLTARIVTRWDRRRTMLLMDALRVGVVIAIPFVSALWWVYLWAFVLEACGLVFLPARDASIPDLAGEDDLPLANGLVLGSSYGTIPLGAAAFGAVSVIVGAHGSHVSPVVFFVDAATFAVSFALIVGLRELDRADRASHVAAAAAGRSDEIRFVDALRLPIIRAVGPPAVVVSLGIGTLFSVGIVFVRDVLSATDSQFSWLVALFGVGAAAGLVALHLSHRKGIRVVQICVVAQGIVIAGMSLSPDISLALVGAVLFGAATAATLAEAMSVVQESLGERERVMAFTVFHIFIRVGLAVAALGAGLAVDVVRGVDWPVVGHLPPARMVLLLSGLVVVAGAVFSHIPSRMLDRP